MIEVVVSRLGLDSSNQSYVLILQEKNGTRVLPIWIGQSEAHSIVAYMHNVKHERPYTHDLCKSLILQLGGSVRRVQVTRIEDTTYYGEIHIDRGGSLLHIDSRPSDAIGIAIRVDAPIFAAESLLVEPDEEDEDSEGGEIRLPGRAVESAQL